MGLFDAFSFKKEAAKVLNKDTFSEILGLARTYIIEYAKKEMPGEEKKRSVDTILIAKIYEKVEIANIKNKLVLWVIDQLVNLLPKVTQIVYDNLKEKVESL